MDQIVGCKFHRKKTVSEWVFAPRAFLSYDTAKTSYIQWNDDDAIRYVLGQHAYSHLYSASSLKQPSSGKHVTPIRQITLIQSQLVFAQYYSVKLCT